MVNKNLLKVYDLDYFDVWTSIIKSGLVEVF